MALESIPEVSEPLISSEKTSAKNSFDLSADNFSQKHIINNVPSKIETGNLVPQICQNSHIEVINEYLKNDFNHSSAQEESSSNSSEFKTVESYSDNNLHPVLSPLSSSVEEELSEESTEESSYSISTEVAPTLK